MSVVRDDLKMGKGQLKTGPFDNSAVPLKHHPYMIIVISDQGWTNFGQWKVREEGL